MWLRRASVALLAAGSLAVVAGGFLPLFGGPTYEFALLAGVLVPSLASVAAALEHEDAALGPRASTGVALRVGATFAAAVLVVATAHGLRVGFCEAHEGFVLLLLGPCSGAVVGASWGAFGGALLSARSAARRRSLVPAALAGPLGSVLVSLWRFYSSPMVFAYDPYAGYFSGTLYDTVVEPSGLLSYRFGSLATLTALAAFAALWSRDSADRTVLVASPWRLARRPAALLAGLAALVSVAWTAAGPRLGHWHTTASIRAALGGELRTERCEVVYALSVGPEEAELFGRECDAHVRVEEAWLGIQYERVVTAFLFESAEQKGALMGAKSTYIAKPWRSEVYLQTGSFPHPVLGHEIAHVLAGAFGRGPLRIAGSLGGLLPNPGLIEGLAVAVSPHEGDLSPEQWAKAMRDIGILPPLARLFTLGFLGENSGVAYTVSGAFVRFVRDREGSQAVRRWYGGESLETVTGSSWVELEGAFQAHLDAIFLPAPTLAQAKARFDRPAIFGRRCPHTVDACLSRARDRSRRGDVEGALAALAEARGLDPDEQGHRLRVADALRVGGRTAEAEVELRAIEMDLTAREDVRERANEELADLLLSTNRAAEAIPRLDRATRREIEEDHLRTLEVKRLAATALLSGDGLRHGAVVELLLGTPPHRPDRVRAAELLGTWAERDAKDGVPRYLLARQHVSAERWELALSLLSSALERSIELPRVRAEALRLTVVAAAALGRCPVAERAAAQYARLALHAFRAEETAAIVERCSLGKLR